MDRTDPKIPKNAGSGPHLEVELEFDDNQSARHSTFEDFEETIYQFQQCKVEAAAESLQAAHKHFLNLTPESFGNPTDHEKEQVDRGRKMCLSHCSAPPFFGVVLLNLELTSDKDVHFYASFAIVFGAVALKLHKYKIAIDLFQRCYSLFTFDTTPRSEKNMPVIDILRAAAKANEGCVYLIMRVTDKARDYLECALEIFETFKNKSKTDSPEINIVAIQTNLSLAYQCQKNYIATVKLQERLILKAKDPILPPHLVAAIHYNRAELFIELKEPVKALMELRTLDSLSERMNNEEAIFMKFISSKICLAYQKIGDVARAEKIVERLTFPSLSPESLSPPLSPSSQSFSTASGSGLGSLSSSSSPSSSSVSSSSSSSAVSSSSSSSSSSISSSSSSASSLMSSFSFFFPDFEVALGCNGQFHWDFLFATILNLVDYHLNDKNLDFASFLDVFVPICKETLGKNHPTHASFLYRQGVRFFLMKKNLSSNNFFEEALSILTSFDYGSDHPDLVQCNIALAKLLLCENFQEVPQLKSRPERSWREFPCNAADGVVSPDIPSFGEDNNKWDSNEEFNEPGKISSQENSEGEHHYRLKNPSQKDKNGRISISQEVMETPNEVSDGRNGVLKASFQGGDVFADSGENRDVLPTNGAYGLDKDWNTQAVALPKTPGDFHETNSKKKRSLGLKGGRRSDLPSGHSSQRDQSEDDFGTNHIGIYPSFLARHSCECRASDEHWDSCGPCEDFELPVGTHSEYNRSGCMPEVYCPTPPSSSTLPECRDSTKFYAGDYSAYASTMGSPPQIYSSRDGYQPQKSSLNLVMPKTVSAKTLGLPQSSSLLKDGSKANLPLTVREFPIGNGRARTPPNIFPNGHVLAERPISPSQLERGDDAPGFLLDGESAGAGQGLLNSNSNTSVDGSLAVLEQRVAEACSLVERTLKERQEREKSMKETERKRKEKRERKEKQARERKEREAREARETELMNERVEENSTSSGQETPSQDSAPAGVRQWLCEHYQRLCRVKFSCCGKFFPCHRCHNNSGCPNDNSKAREACSVECSVCSHQQEVNRNDIDLKFFIRGKRVLPLRL